MDLEDLLSPEPIEPTDPIDLIDPIDPVDPVDPEETEDILQDMLIDPEVLFDPFFKKALKHFKYQLDIDDNSQDYNLISCLADTVEYVRSYCLRDDIPFRLWSTIVALAKECMESATTGISTSTIEADTIKKITEGDVTTEFFAPGTVSKIVKADTSLQSRYFVILDNSRRVKILR